MALHMTVSSIMHHKVARSLRLAVLGIKPEQRGKTEQVNEAVTVGDWTGSEKENGKRKEDEWSNPGDTWQPLMLA